ncbi:MAG: hypothetical protein OXG33_13125 [Chloroflexi bacterium]|nr:hypothetical protein [Chloroflexota bacterium]
MARHGWLVQRVSIANASEFTSDVVWQALADAGLGSTRVYAGQPECDGCVEHVHNTLVEECNCPAPAGALISRFAALRTDLARSVRYYYRTHSGRRTQGRTPSQVFGATEVWPLRSSRSVSPVATSREEAT